MFVMPVVWEYNHLLLYPLFTRSLPVRRSSEERMRLCAVVRQTTLSLLPRIEGFCSSQKNWTDSKVTSPAKQWASVTIKAASGNGISKGGLPGRIGGCYHVYNHHTSSAIGTSFYLFQEVARTQPSH